MAIAKGFTLQPGGRRPGVERPDWRSPHAAMVAAAPRQLRPQTSDEELRSAEKRRKIAQLQLEAKQMELRAKSDALPVQPLQPVQPELHCFQAVPVQAPCLTTPAAGASIAKTGSMAAAGGAACGTAAPPATTETSACAMTRGDLAGAGATGTTGTPGSMAAAGGAAGTETLPAGTANAPPATTGTFASGMTVAGAPPPAA